MAEKQHRRTSYVGVGCASDLEEKGKAILFESGNSNGKPGFVVKFNGEIYAYINSCPHTGSELDWDIGEFFDADGEALICATHGALFEPHTGLCFSGPCVNQRLISVPLKLVGKEIFVAIEVDD